MMTDTCQRLQETLRLKEDQIASLCMVSAGSRTDRYRIHQDSNAGAGGRRALENALKRLDEKSQRVLDLEEELLELRGAVAAKPRDFTDKVQISNLTHRSTVIQGVTSHEMMTLRMKLERSEVELSERKSELLTCQTRYVSLCRFHYFHCMVDVEPFTGAWENVKTA